MINIKIVKDESGTFDLCETFSTIGMKLRQLETSIVYGHSVIDVIAGYGADGKPYSRFTYEETDIPDEPSDDDPTREELKEMLNIITGGDNDE